MQVNNVGGTIEKTVESGYLEGDRMEPEKYGPWRLCGAGTEWNNFCS